MKKLLAITSVLLLAGGMATSASAQSRDSQGYQGYQAYQGYSNGDDQGEDSQSDDNDDSDRNDGQSYDQYGDGQRQVQVDQYGNVIRQARYDQYGNAQRQVQYDRDGERAAYGDDRDDGRDQRDHRGAYGNGHDSRDFGHSHNARHRYQAGRYAGPRGYRGNRWNVGTRLPVGYYGSSYYLEPRSYGLSYPSRGYRWARVGNDAYLVSTSNGLIRDVIYSLFR